MRVLTLLHRWWGVVFCLLFAMWFASGVVMHFVPFPERLGADRFAGGMLIDRDKVAHGPSEAVAASDILDASGFVSQEGAMGRFISSPEPRQCGSFALPISETAAFTPNQRPSTSQPPARGRLGSTSHVPV
jgi:hypothetical protein